jgi:hypothetical protein
VTGQGIVAQVLTDLLGQAVETFAQINRSRSQPDAYRRGVRPANRVVA